MRAEPHTTSVAGSAGPSAGRVHWFASARSESLVASSPGPSADDETSSTLRSCVTGLDVRCHAGVRSDARSIRYGIDTAVEGCMASRVVPGHCAITALSEVTSPARHPSIDLDQPRPGNPARHPQRLADRPLPRTD